MCAHVPAVAVYVGVIEPYALRQLEIPRLGICRAQVSGLYDARVSQYCRVVRYAVQISRAIIAPDGFHKLSHFLPVFNQIRHEPHDCSVIIAEFDRCVAEKHVSNDGQSVSRLRVAALVSESHHIAVWGNVVCGHEQHFGSGVLDYDGLARRLFVLGDGIERKGGPESGQVIGAMFHSAYALHRLITYVLE